jgi:hypothetical protein
MKVILIFHPWMKVTLILDNFDLATKLKVFKNFGLKIKAWIMIWIACALDCAYSLALVGNAKIQTAQPSHCSYSCILSCQLLN